MSARIPKALHLYRNTNSTFKYNIISLLYATCLVHEEPTIWKAGAVQASRPLEPSLATWPAVPHGWQRSPGKDELVSERDGLGTSEALSALS